MFGKKDESKSNDQRSDHDKALEEEYYTKRGDQIYSKSEQEWNKYERRLKEIEQEQKKRK